MNIISYGVFRIDERRLDPKSDAGSMNSQPPDAGEEESVAQAGSIPETYLQYDFS